MAEPARANARIAILLPDLRPGGAERLHLHLAEAWIERGLQVEFVLRRARGDLLARLPPGATVHDLQADRVRSSLWPLVRYLRAARPDVLLAAMWPLTVVAPIAARLAGFAGRVAVSEHSPLARAYAGRGRMHRILLRASTWLGYRLADVRIGVSGGVADDMARLSAMARAAIAVVHNPAASGNVPENAPRPQLLAGRNGLLLLSVGTLKQVKRHDLLIRAFASADIPDSTLCILGEGPERPALEALVRECGMQDRVLLPGYQPDPAPWYAHADLFVLSSDYEGFGNVLVEAMEHGVPVVSTDCPAGPREILAEGRYGTLVATGDVEALATAMGDALSGGHDREALKRRAADFSVDKVSRHYLGLLLDGRGARA